jgi:hypothetical protein
MSESEKPIRKDKILWLLIPTQLCIFLFLTVPPFFKHDPIVYIDMNIMFALLLSMFVSLVGVSLLEEKLDLLEMKVKKLETLLGKQGANTEDD